MDVHALKKQGTLRVMDLVIIMIGQTTLRSLNVNLIQIPKIL